MSIQQIQQYLITVPRMETIFIYGPTGSGKSIFGAFTVAKHHYILGRRIVGNVHYDIPDSIYIDPIDIIVSLDKTRQHESRYGALLNDMTPKTLVLDEIGKWWNNRNHESFTNKLLGYFVDQCRKRNIKLIVIDQHVSGFDVKGRDHVEKLIRCYCEYIPDTDIPWTFNYIQFEKQKYKVKAFKLPAQYMIRAFGDMYDTNEHVTPVEFVLDDSIIDTMIEIQKNNNSRGERILQKQVE